MSDTTDITRRLYDMANHLCRQDADLCDAAADEITRLRAALGQAGAPEGWRLVPLEPTPEMIRAFAKEWHRPHESTMRSAIRAMLEAAPITNPPPHSECR